MHDFNQSVSLVCMQFPIGSTNVYSSRVGLSRLDQGVLVSDLLDPSIDTKHSQLLHLGEWLVLRPVDVAGRQWCTSLHVRQVLTHGQIVEAGVEEDEGAGTDAERKQLLLVEHWEHLEGCLHVTVRFVHVFGELIVEDGHGVASEMRGESNLNNLTTV